MGTRLGRRWRAVGEPGQAEQVQASVTATYALVRSFAKSEIDVAIDDLMLPADTEDVWQPMLNGLSTQLFVVLPSLEEALHEVAAGVGTSPSTSLLTSTTGPPDGPVSDSSTPPGRRSVQASALLERMSTTAAQWP